MLALALAASGCATMQGTSLYRSGTAALDRGDATAAVADLEQAARLIPQSSPVFNHLGIAYKESGRYEEALWAFQRAVDLDCDNRAAVANLQAAEAHARATTAAGR
ncbi:MAG: tetratricopeptide repeat protein [Myxococcota bacterium]|nr:tetratricopeptide repeat protein [Myxococcota bacterium]